MIAEPIAIVGIGCRFPGSANTPEALWRRLLEGFDGFKEIPKDRWDHRRFYDPNPETPAKMNIEEGAFLEQPIFEFDPEPFGLTPAESERMDPQQRLLLETTWEAFEHAGIVLDDIRGTNTGVFVGGFTLDNMNVQFDVDNHHLIDRHSATSASHTMLSNRLSHLFDLRGPSVSMDTACSSSLTATHFACQSIWSGTSDQAIVGGVNIMLRPGFPIAMSKGGFLSPHSRCMMFDERAAGYARGEGAGVVVLKPLSKARRDGDRIYACIVATGTNQDGRTAGISRPNQQAQVDLLSSVLASADIDPRHVRYTEAHGTGTQAGDKAEATALDEALGKRDRDNLLVGSIKTNIGHLEAAAGIAGLIKASLCLHHRQVPPNLHFEQPNPDIPFDDICLEVAQAVRSLDEDPTYVGVNSFGYGGTNAHVLLQPAPDALSAPPAKPAPSDTPPLLLPLSACSDDALQQRASQWADRLADDATLRLSDALHTTIKRSSAHRHRLVALGDSREELIDRLRDASRERAHRGLATGSVTWKSDQPVFVYTGMGPQWWGMGRGLMRESTYREALEEVDARFGEIAGWSILEELQKSEVHSQIHKTRIAQPANFALQYALTQLWKSWGIEPSAVIGHSVGEVAAAWASGALSLNDALTVSHHRSRLQQAVALEEVEDGAMLAAGIDRQAARDLVADHPGTCIAAFNSASNITFSGDPEAISSLSDTLQNRGLFNRILDVEVAYHSHFMDPVKETLENALADIKPRPTHCPLYSTVTGKEIDGTCIDGSYWSQNMRRPVRFEDGMTELIHQDYRVFVEVGPHPVLRNAITESLREADVNGEQFPTIRQKEDEKAQMLQTLGNLYARGSAIQWECVTRTDGGFVPPPRYPWQRSYYWMESQRSQNQIFDNADHPLLQIPSTGASLQWTTDLSEQYLPWLSDHAIDDHVVVPGAAYIETALAVGRTINADDSLLLEDLDLSRILSIDDQSVTDLEISVDDHHHITIASSRRGDANWSTHARAWLGFNQACKPDAEPIESITERLAQRLDIDSLYRQLDRAGLQYGPSFRSIQSLCVGSQEVVATLAVDDCGADYVVHPAILDGAFQAATATIDSDHFDAPLVPVGAARIEWHDRIADRARAHITVRHLSGAEVLADIALYTDETLAALLTGVAFRPLSLERRDGDDLVDYEFRWEEIGPPNAQESDRELPATLVVADGSLHQYFAPGPLPQKTASWSAESPPHRDRPCLTSAADPQSFASTCEDEAIEQVLFIPPPTAHNPVQHLEELTWKLAAIANALSSLQTPPTLALAYVEGHSLIGPSLEPAFRVIRSEFPHLRGDIVVIETTEAGPSSSWPDMAAELADTSSCETRLLATGRQQRHLLPLDKPSVHEASVQQLNTDHPVALQVGDSATLGALHHAPFEPRDLGPQDVRIRVAKTPLNFKDLLKYTAQIDARVTRDTFFGQACGMECVGVVDAIGSDVTDFTVGDRVGTFAREGCYRSYVTPTTATVAPLPEGISFDHAISTFIPFLTAWHSLREVARLRPGETVLIHSAAGGVGFMAVQVAQHLGATVLATAGTEEKRDLLREAGVEHVSDSRSLQYVDDIRQWTHGEGVDVVLSAQSGTAMRESIRLLGRFGRYLDIGKRAHVDNEKLSLRSFNEALTYAAIDMDRLLDADPAYCIDIAKKGLELVANNQLERPPITTYSPDTVSDAFRHMATGDHYGRLVVDYTDQPIDVVCSTHGEFDNKGFHIITGGLGGFGREVANYLAARGASRLLLLSRRGMDTPGADETVDELTELGAQVRVASVDVTDRKGLADILDSARHEAPIRGVFHCAMVLRDQLISSLTREGLSRVLAPKALGAWHLHNLTANDPIEHFVNFSSVSTILGTTGQLSYATANGFLDALADARCAVGQSAISVQWGVLGEVGVAARNDGIRDSLSESGLVALDNKTALQGLERALHSERSQLGIFQIDWEKWSKRFPDTASISIYDQVRTHDARYAPALEVARSLLDTDPTRWVAAVAKRIRPQIADALQIDEDIIPYDEPLSDVGLDSLLAAEVAGELGAQGYPVEVMDLVGGSTIDQLAQKSVKSLRSTCRERLHCFDTDALSDRELTHLQNIISNDGDGDL